ncbi:hypothetical protein [Maritalea sp.]|uniref:hypothetical protein n=1 Tax=Maritalea sp. TaxID=2003361 RepID=UPI003EF75729
MSLKTLPNWPSLAPQFDLERLLFGDKSTRLRKWCADQIDLMTDPDFARLFSDNIDKFDVASSAYNHRHITTKHGELLGGIRFYGLDVERPFVEIIAHSFDDFERLRSTVQAEWAIFAPQFLRLVVAKDQLPTPDAVLDLSIHGARYQDMKVGENPVELVHEEDAKAIYEVVRTRYAALELENREMARNISVAERSELQSCAAQDGLFSARLIGEDVTIGVIAVRQAGIDWIEGDEVVEEVTAIGSGGNGYAVHMQQALAELRSVNQPNRLLIGTIERHNHSSRKSATRAGRPEILRKVFVPLEAR